MIESQARIIVPLKTGTYRLNETIGSPEGRIVRILDCVVSEENLQDGEPIYVGSEIHPISMSSNEDTFHLTLKNCTPPVTATVTLGKVHRIITVMSPPTEKPLFINMIVQLMALPDPGQTITVKSGSVPHYTDARPYDSLHVSDPDVSQPNYKEKFFMSRSTTAGAILAITTVLAFVIGIWALFAFERVTVESGTEALVMEQPYFPGLFGEGGLSKTTLKPGSHWLWSTSLTKPMVTVPEQHGEQIIDASTAENNFLDYDTTVTVQVLDVYAMYSEFRDRWYEINVQKPYQSIVRGAVKGYKFDAIMTDNQVTVDIENTIIDKMNTFIAEKKLPIRIVDVSIGRAKPDPKVAEEMAKTAGEAQRLKTLINTTAAEKKRKESETERANADNAYRMAMSLSVNDFVELRVAQLYSEACMKGMNCYINAGGIPLIVGK